MDRLIGIHAAFFISRGFDDEEGVGSVGGRSKSGAGSTAAGLEGEDGNILSNISNVSNVVVGRVGNMFGKGIGGLSSKLGGGGWF